MKRGLVQDLHRAWSPRKNHDWLCEGLWVSCGADRGWTECGARPVPTARGWRQGVRRRARSYALAWNLRRAWPRNRALLPCGNPRTANFTTLGTDLIFRVQSRTSRKVSLGDSGHNLWSDGSDRHRRHTSSGSVSRGPTRRWGRWWGLQTYSKPHMGILWLLRKRGSCPWIKDCSGQLLPLQVLSWN